MKIYNSIKYFLLPKLKHNASVVIKYLNWKNIYTDLNKIKSLDAAIEKLNYLSRKNISTKHSGDVTRYVLIDGMWHNPNYWLRFSMIRSALGLFNYNEIGLVGKYSKNKSTRIFKKFLIKDIINFQKNNQINDKHYESAKKLLKNIKTRKDILNLSLPFDLPGIVFYDAILKHQKKATIDINDPELKFYFAHGLACIDAANKILEKYDYKYLILSHMIDFSYGALAWCAIKKKIPVILLYGDYGTSRFMLLRNENDFFAYPSRPTFNELSKLSVNQSNNLINVGNEYLNLRLSGKTNDISTKYAYKLRKKLVTKEILCKKYGWDISKPIIGIYASNWFDYPHAHGLKHFDDFYDWISSTLFNASNNFQANWIIKPHPCDEWYGVNDYSEILDIIQNTNNIKMSDSSWNGLELINSLDAIVTSHGTIGVEAAYLEKPVLAVGESWYTCGEFVTTAKDKDDYLNRLEQLDWLNFDKSKHNIVRLLSGLYWAVPKWQNGFYMTDDSEGDNIYLELCNFLDNNANEYIKEIKEIKNWHDTGHSYYQIYKNISSKEYCMPKI